MTRLIFNQPDKTFPLLEFGVASGNRFTKLLHFRDYWASRLHIANRIMVMGFDTFEGLPSPRSDDIAVDNWREGDFPGDLGRVADLLRDTVR